MIVYKFAIGCEALAKISIFVKSNIDEVYSFVRVYLAVEVE